MKEKKNLSIIRQGLAITLRGVVFAISSHARQLFFLMLMLIGPLPTVQSRLSIDNFTVNGAMDPHNKIVLDSTQVSPLLNLVHAYAA